MSTRVDASGRRWVRAEVETPGSIEEVWQAISTEAGLASWFTRANFELDADGQPERLICHFGPDISSAAAVTEWDPPRGFAVTSDEFIEGGPPVATVWKIEKCAGELCTLRVEHSLFVDNDAYDGHIEATEAGWPAFFRILQIYMTHYRGQPCALLELMGAASEAVPCLGQTVCLNLGISATEPGGRCTAPTWGPNFAGVVDTVPDETEIIYAYRQTDLWRGTHFCVAGRRSDPVVGQSSICTVKMPLKSFPAKNGNGVRGWRTGSPFLRAE